MNIPDRWTFQNGHVAEHFDKHVREQLPWYELVTKATAFIARQYIQPGTRVYDIGASTGNIGRALKDTLQERKADLIAVESSAHMAKLYDAPGQVHLTTAQAEVYEPFSVAILFLTLQFVPPDERPRLLRKLTTKMAPTGVIIVVDKHLPHGFSGEVDSALYRLTLQAKLDAGATPDEIIEKELSLVGSARPYHLHQLLLMEDIHATEFFRYGHFAGHALTRT